MRLHIVDSLSGACCDLSDVCSAPETRDVVQKHCLWMVTYAESLTTALRAEVLGQYIQADDIAIDVYEHLIDVSDADREALGDRFTRGLTHLGNAVTRIRLDKRRQ